jgi:UrcA family protein
MHHPSPRLALSIGAIACSVLLGPAPAIADSDAGSQVSSVSVPSVTRQPTDESGPDRGPIEILSLSLAVSYKDLDLTTQPGVAELERRVRQAAEAACGQIDAQYPQQLYVPTPGGQLCVKTAVEGAMPQIRRIIAAGGGQTWIAAVGDPTR